MSWTALNSGNPLVAKGTGSQWDFNGAANPKCLQMPDGSYVIQYAGSDDTTNSDWQIGFATAPSRGGPYTKLAANPVVGRSGGSYGYEPSHFSWDESGTSFFNIGQRFDTTSNTAHAYFLYDEPAQGGLLLSRADADGTVAGRLMDAGTWTAESRSVITAQRADNATPLLLGLYNSASLPSPGVSSTFSNNRGIEIIRWSQDTATPGDITFSYWDNSGTRYFWNGSAWTTSSTGRARPADNAREVVATITDDGTNYILKAVYADDGSTIAGPASIAKSSVRAMPLGRMLLAGDPFTDEWTGGLFLRYLDVRPYAAVEPSPSVGSQVIVEGSPPTAPMIVDAGFEQVPVGAGQFQYRPAGSAWTFAGGAGVSGNGSGFTAGNPPAPQGVQVAFLQSTGSFSQVVDRLGRRLVRGELLRRPARQLPGVAAGLQRAGRRRSGGDFHAVGDVVPGVHHVRFHGGGRVAHDRPPGSGHRRRGQHRLRRPGRRRHGLGRRCWTIGRPRARSGPAHCV